MDRKGSATRHAEAPADVVFAVVTDLAGLPAWNERITGVVEVPSTLEVGAEWVVGIKLPGKRFNSRSVVLELDEARRRFVHRSKPDDDNPSSTVWTWEVEPEGTGSRVTVTWHLQPVTPARRFLAAPLRAWQIPRTDAPSSLDALVRVCEAHVTGPQG
ncbi:MAG TPA: SRPBCC family protein [Acidimicrobiales bacterium]|nr:SRPBCC family protein [Acidimicrobiales bacterium]